MGGVVRISELDQIQQLFYEERALFEIPGRKEG